jgi:hypothetical protein
MSAALFLAVAPAYSHHSYTSEYDSTKPFTVVGRVSRLEWTNPHAFLYVDVKDQKGKVTAWEFEMGSPNGLIRRGWTRTSLKPGDLITVDAFPSKTTAGLANARLITFSDGRKLLPLAPQNYGPALKSGNGASHPVEK